MKAVVLSKPDNFQTVDVARPEPRPDEVVLAVAACGICGTDLHTIQGRNALVRYPIIPGHEFVGTVSACGDQVSSLKIGDRVAIDPSRSCGHCSYCRGGRPNLCPDKGGYGSRYPGGFSEYVVALEASCVILDNTLKWERAVLAEPLACVLHGIDRLGPVLGKNTVVFGAGTIGMLSAALLLEGGAEVQMVEPAPTRRLLAQEWGIDCAARVEEFANPEGWDCVIDATGVPAAIQEAVKQVRRAGTILLLGVAPEEATIEVSPYLVNWQELTIIGSMAIRHSFQRAVELLPKLSAPLESLVTHRLALTEFAQGIDLIKGRDAMKVIIQPNDAAR